MGFLRKSKKILTSGAVAPKRFSLHDKKTKLITKLNAFKDSKVCIVRSVGGIGDVLMITPALRALKELHT